MTYTILADGHASRDRLALVDNCFIHLSDGSAVWLAMDANTGLVSLWGTFDRSQTATLIDDEVDGNAWAVAAREESWYSRYALARDNNDNIFMFTPADVNRFRCWTKGAGYTWIGNPRVAASFNQNFNRGLVMLWCNTGGDGHLLLLGPANGTASTAGSGGDWMTVDCGPLIAGSGTPTAQVGTDGPFSNLRQVEGDTSVPFVDAAAHGVGAISGLAATTSQSGLANRAIGVGSWSVAADGTPTFGYIGTPAQNTRAARLRVLHVATNRWAVVSGMIGHQAPAVALYSSTALIAGPTGPDAQVTDWPYPTFGRYGTGANSRHPNWDVGLDRTRRTLWVYATNPEDPAMYRLGCSVAGDVIVWDDAVTVDDPAFGEVHGPDAGGGADRSPHLRCVRQQVTSVCDYQANHFVAVSSLRAVRGSASIYNQPPYAPDLMFPVGNTINVETGNRFSWEFSDPDPGDHQSRYDLQVRAQGTSTLLLDVTQQIGNQYRDVTAGTLPAGELEWRVRTYDAVGDQGVWSAWTPFTAAETPDGPTLLSPENNATVATPTFLVEWNASAQDRYQLRRVADDSGDPDDTTVLFDTGPVASTSSRERMVEFPTTGQHEHVQVRVEVDTLWSPWTSARVHVNYAAPAQPTVHVVSDMPTGAVSVWADHPSPQGDEPAVTSMHVVRRRVRDSTPEQTVRLRRGITPDAVTEDWTVASGETYEYQVVAVGDNGATTASGWAL